MLELAAQGEPLPPVGVVADLGQLALGRHAEFGVPQVPGVPPGLLRRYEDYVISKLAADSSFERAADSLRRFQGRDQNRALAFLTRQFQARAGFGGVLLSPAVLKTLGNQPGDATIAQAWAELANTGFLPILLEQYEELIDRTRVLGTILSQEDVFELEHGTALAEFSQRLALRQVLQATQRLLDELPTQRPRIASRQYDHATHLLDEDQYPVGGFTSISTRGTIESLLHSQLAYMEPEDRPDLFDLKYLRDELLYYSRDENQFFRRRRTYVFVLPADLARSRVKDAQAPWQRVILLLGFVHAVVRKLTEWQSTDALVFHFVFLESEEERVLAEECRLLEMLFREQIANGTVELDRYSAKVLKERLQTWSRRSRCSILFVTAVEGDLQSEVAQIERLKVAGPVPELRIEGEAVTLEDETDPVYHWQRVLRALLEAWL
jgi:hypothetical protein